MVRSKIWKAGLLKPDLKAKSTDGLVCELADLQIRRHKASRRQQLLLKLSASLAAVDFNRMQGEVTAEIAQMAVAIMNLELEIKQRGVKL